MFSSADKKANPLEERAPLVSLCSPLLPPSYIPEWNLGAWTCRSHVQPWSSVHRGRRKRHTVAKDREGVGYWWPLDPACSPSVFVFRGRSKCLYCLSHCYLGILLFVTKAFQSDPTENLPKGNGVCRVSQTHFSCVCVCVSVCAE